MLEHMRQASLAFRIVYGSGVDVSVKRDHRSFVALEHNEMQAVRQSELGNMLLELVQILCAKRKGECDGQEQVWSLH